jgi:hypothetical protein
MTPAKPLLYLPSPLFTGGHCCICARRVSTSGMAAGRFLQPCQRGLKGYLGKYTPASHVLHNVALTALPLVQVGVHQASHRWEPQ